VGFFNYPGTTEDDVRRSDVELLEGISPDDWAKILKVVIQIHFKSGDNLVTFGESGDSFYILVSGSADVLIPSKNGPEQHLAVIPEGSVFGEMSFFDDQPRSATIRAREDGTAVRIDRKSFDALASWEPVIARQMLHDLGRVLSRRLRWETQRSTSS